MAPPVKKPVRRDEDRLVTLLKYILLAGLVVGIGYASYAGQSANNRSINALRASCSGGGGLTGFGSCR